jgi:heterotetrameric sarcosine oxidase delta subunit
MLRIACPDCGPRAEIEFRWGGDAHVARPPFACDDVAWGRYLFQRRNAKGLQLERWQHVAGCRQWFNLARDTVTHEIAAVYRMGEVAPAGIAERLA